MWARWTGLLVMSSKEVSSDRFQRALMTICQNARIMMGTLMRIANRKSDCRRKVSWVHLEVGLESVLRHLSVSAGLHSITIVF